MPIIDSDWTVDASTGAIRYIGDDHGGASPSYATVLELHRWLQDRADDATWTGDDEVDITVPSPSERQTDQVITLLNGFNIDATASEHLYGGSIIQNGGDDIYDGFVNVGNSTQIQAIQNGAVIADDWWNSLGGLNATAAYSHQFMLPTRVGGADIDGGRIVGTSRNWGKTFAEFSVTAQRGVNVLALFEQDDVFNQNSTGSVAAWSISVVNEGYSLIDASGDGTPENYFIEIDAGVRSPPDIYEWAKYQQRDGSASTLFGLSGELFRGITHQVPVDTPTGVFVEPEGLTWATGTGQLLAIDDPSAGTVLWMQLLTGVAPINNQTITGATSGATVDVNGAVIGRTISTPFVGASTGAALLGAYGAGVQADDLTASDRLRSLADAQVTPPNNVTFSVLGLVSGEDRVFVGPATGGVLNENQMLLATTLNGAAVNTIQMAAPIPADSPASGTIRVINNDGRAVPLDYVSYAGDTFTLAAPADFSGVNATAGNGAYVTYLDKVAGASTEQFTVVFSAVRDLFIRVRDGGGTPIKPFETTGQLTSAGGSSTVIRTADA